jgi:hypothetical protein
VVAWVALFWQRVSADSYMAMASPTMGLAAPLFLRSWVAMMAAMMFPAAARMILTFHQVQSGKAAVWPSIRFDLDVRRGPPLSPSPRENQNHQGPDRLGRQMGRYKRKAGIVQLNPRPPHRPVGDLMARLLHRFCYNSE